MANKIKNQLKKWLLLLLITIIVIFFWYTKPPTGLSTAAWKTVIIFVATITAIISKVLPIGAIGLIGITIFAFSHAAGDKSASDAIISALSEFNSSLIWLIVISFMISRGFIKTNLGRRIALHMIRLIGNRTLGLAYGLAVADLILAPAMPSNTARCGGIIYPIANSLARSFNSYPENDSRQKIGTFLITCISNINDITAAMFMTAYTGNLLIVKLAANEGIIFTWGNWLLAAIIPCLISFIIIPLLTYWLVRPTICYTPDAPKVAYDELKKMGRIAYNEWVMLVTVLFLLILWMFGDTLGIVPTTAAFTGLSVLLLTGVLTWEDVKKEKDAWDTLIWFAALLMMANKLKTLGFTSWLGNLIGDTINYSMLNTNWVIILIMLNIAYFYIHYFFASGNAQIAALYAVFLGVGINLGIPIVPTAFMLAFSSSLYCSLTQYSHARGPILFSSGYVPIGIWWQVNFIISLVNQVIFLIIGLLWWKIVGFY